MSQTHLSIFQISLLQWLRCCHAALAGFLLCLCGMVSGNTVQVTCFVLIAISATPIMQQQDFKDRSRQTLPLAG